MLLSDWRVLLRRWYISVAGLLVTAALCLTAMTLVPPTYQLTAQVSLLPNTEILKGDDQVPNPYLALGGLDGIADLVSRSMSDAQSAEAVKKAGGEGEYKIELDTSSPAPLLLMTVESPSPAAANKLTDLLLERLPGNLHDLQASSNTPERAMVKSKLLTRDEETTTVRKAQTRALVVAGGGGVVLTYVVAAVLDGALARRRRRDEDVDDEYLPDEPPARPARPQPRPQARPAQPRPRPQDQDRRQRATRPAQAAAAPAPARPATPKKRPRPAAEAAPVSPLPPAAPARPADPPADGLEATLAGLLEPGDLEVPAGDARFTDDRTGQLPVVRPAGANGPDPDTQPGATVNGGTVNGAAVNGGTVNGAAVNGAGRNGAARNGSAVNGHTPAEADRGEAEEHDIAPHRPRLDEDADLPLGGGGETGLGRSRTLTSIRPRHSRPVPPPQ